VWTPKRIVLLASGIILFVAAYWTYAFFLGGIDGLPPLPEGLRDDPDGSYADLPPPPISLVDQKLIQAFNERCPEIDRPIRLEVRSKGLVLAAGDFSIEQPGGQRVLLKPFSLAIFSKEIGPEQFPEINTVRSREAYLTLDRPINNITEIGNRKIVAGLLQGDIRISNNRRTQHTGDDILVRSPGPLHFEEDRHLIWTDNTVELKDMQTQPKPMTINANGMELRLITENQPPRPPQAGSRKPKTETISGVESVLLKSHVEMELWVDARFLSAGKSGTPKPATGDGQPERQNPEASPRAKVRIDTQGPFFYDVVKERAQFDVSKHPSNFHNRVTVTRYHEDNKYDVLDCERLELQFRRKNPSGTSAVREDRSMDLDIEHAHATGKEVILISDLESLAAHGNDFFYDARTGLSTLKGDPVFAAKEGNELYARELQLLNQKGAQQATALGPGAIALLDKSSGKRPLYARWKDKLVSTRDGPHDLLIVTGDGAFIDDDQIVVEKLEHLLKDEILLQAKSILRGETLKVWLEGGNRAGAVADQARPSPHGQRPHHLEAASRVFLRSPEMNISDADHLVVWFKDAPPGNGELPATLPPAGQNQGSAPGTGTGHRAGKPPAPPAGHDSTGPLAKPVDTTQAKPQKPINLSARSVKAYVVRLGNKNELDNLWTEGSVRVRQDPATSQEKGVDIRGDTLQLTRKPGGNHLVVTGDLAHLEMDKLCISGPQVDIDQSVNQAWVNGDGFMRMESNTDFQGGKLKRTVPLTIYWKKVMVFNGKDAEFHGDVLAEQENSRLLCQALQVSLDQPVSLREGDRGGPPAKVQHLVCDQGVRIEDVKRDGNKLIQHQRIEAPALTVDNEEGIVKAPGPGIVRILQCGTVEFAGDNAKTQPRPATPTSRTDEELKLTRVKYGAHMWAKNKTHTAIFYEDVEVVHLPSKRIDLVPDLDNLPAGAIHLRCGVLKVYNRPDNGKPNQQMEARGKVVAKAQEFTARAEIVTYDEGKDQLIFEGGEGGLARVYRAGPKGEPPQELKAKKILYNRRTGEFQGIDVSGVGGN